MFLARDVTNKHRNVHSPWCVSEDVLEDIWTEGSPETQQKAKMSTPVKSLIFTITCASVTYLSLGERAGVAGLAAVSSNSLAMMLYKVFVPHENIFFSPFSVTTVIAMTFLGTQNDTAAQIRYLLKLEASGSRDKDFHENFRHLITSFLEHNQHFQLQTINAFVIQKGIDINANYKSDLDRFYNASVQEVNFQEDPETTVQWLNSWIRQKTGNKIQNIFMGALNPLTRLLILSIVSFKGSWLKEFDESATRLGSFYSFGTNETQVLMMHKKYKFPYGFDPELDAFVLAVPYSGTSFHMIFFLPRESQGLNKLEAVLDLEKFEEVISKLHETEVEISIPKFQLDKEYDLEDSLRKLGLTHVFSPGVADFSKFTTTKSLHLSSVKHRALLDVDEHGSKVIVSTASLVETLSLKPTFTVNHPFMFFIREDQNGVILFLGRINQL
ncbi:serpin B6-like isoform X2 [Tachypleus tridentatus]|uniref:serpin B6-like isoform X2 n=1 Tax=Tachypleus tridentatus TaxID=6853 RepID=UPI003FD01D94